MPRAKRKTPNEIVEILAMKEAGWTEPAIAQKLDISISTIRRITKKHGVKTGAAQAALVQQAREQLLDNAFLLDRAQEIAASMVNDDFALAQQIRQKVSEAIESIDPTAGPLALRGLAAAATALKLTQDVCRRALPLERLNEALHVEEMPELVIRVMTAEDVKELRERQRRELAVLNGEVIDDEESPPIPEEGDGIIVIDDSD
ncbi:helix-turn-helix domain-containing protein [Azotobacter chroococcum]|nr:helix-turn-helix domain-containing protein [Azotobacter chroococcum]